MKLVLLNQFLFLLCFSVPIYITSTVLNPDVFTLLALVRHWTFVPPSIDSTWNPSDSTSCSWVGVGCDSDYYVVSLNLSSLGISGQLGPEIANLHHLHLVDFSNNSFFGTIPERLGSCSLLEYLDLSMNNFTGEIPNNLRKLQNLRFLNLNSNSLNGKLPELLFQMQHLQYVFLSSNNFSGSIPWNVGNMSEVVTLCLYDNHFSGTIPNSIENCGKLEELYLNKNRLVGFWPESLDSLENLVYLDVSENFLQGSIPFGSGGCKKLDTLILSFNGFSTSIPPSLGNCSSLRTFTAVSSSLIGSIPSSFGLLNKLSNLHLSENHLSGKLPPELGRCKSLRSLQLYNNQLEGEIPKELGMLSELQDLQLFSNRLTGEIPLELRELIRLQRLDISLNNLTGGLAALGDIHSLLELNISYNHFTGPISGTLIMLLNSSPSSFLGSPGLCISCLPSGGITCIKNSNFKLCDRQTTNRKGVYIAQIVKIVIGTFLIDVIVILGMVGIYFLCRFLSCCKGPVPVFEKLMKATKNLDERYIIGRGAQGIVYKAMLAPDEVFAVKKIVFERNNGGRQSMNREIETIGKVGHRNLVRLEDFWLTNEYGLLLYKYMENGSLHDVLHGTSPPQTLDWSVRYNIAVGIADGLFYLHHDCKPAILHRDIKPKNILLDSEMVPHISDFGLAMFLDQSIASVASTSVARPVGIVGTVGFIAPENTYTTMHSKEADVYSYGVVLLELITRKKALDPSFRKEINIVGWVRAVWSRLEEIDKIVDSSLLKEFSDSNIMEQVIEVLSVALRCTEREVSKRPPMREVLNLLLDAYICPLRNRS